MLHHRARTGGEIGQPIFTVQPPQLATTGVDSVDARSLLYFRVSVILAKILEE